MSSDGCTAIMRARYRPVAGWRSSSLISMMKSSRYPSGDFSGSRVTWYAVRMTPLGWMIAPLPWLISLHRGAQRWLETRTTALTTPSSAGSWASTARVPLGIPELSRQQHN